MVEPSSDSAAGGGGPIVVAGMHRSGTSLVGSMLLGAGVAMGERQLAADPHNPRGYFEDVEFLTLQRRMLWTATPDGDGGHRDWGWTESGALDEAAFAPFAGEARALVEARRHASTDPSGGRWGWKDPRTTVLLDFWQPLLPEARYLLVYRHPWGVADSMQRLGAEVFLRHPDYAYRIWEFYNERLLRFRRAHRERTLLVSADALSRDPARLAPLLAARLGVSGTGDSERFEAELFRSLPADDPLVSLVAATHPRCVELLAALDGEAELSGRGSWRAAPLSPKDSPQPRLSVVVPCFDQGEMMVEAVASVERAVAEPYELLIVNDGSREPRTLEVLGVLREAGYRVLDQDNRGLAAARNRGIEEAKAPYVLPLDADNRLRAGFVGEALRRLDERPTVGVVYGDRVEFGLRNGRVDVPPFELPKVLAGNYVDACALVRKEAWRASGGFDGGMPEPGWEDWDLWLGIAAAGWSVDHLPVDAFDYRVRPGSMITAFEDAAVRRRVLAYVVDKHRRTYLQHLDELLFFAQGSAREIWRLARLCEATQRAVDGVDELRAQADTRLADLLRARREAEQLRADLDAQTVETHRFADLWADAQSDRAALREEREALYRDREAPHRDRAAIDHERASLFRELAAWQERARAMEGSRAWRLRGRLLALLRALGLKGGLKSVPAPVPGPDSQPEGHG
ncbi:MAG TPA: glycosyltransferase [Thermoanaerobaculia bacterium]|nr:glycosyltransferase [Thermoanaerobaculia bacterium]